MGRTGAKGNTPSPMPAAATKKGAGSGDGLGSVEKRRHPLANAWWQENIFQASRPCLQRQPGLD